MFFVFIMDVLPDEHGNRTRTEGGVTSLVLLVIFIESGQPAMIS